MSVDDVWTGPAREGSAADIGIRWRVEGTTGLSARHDRLAGLSDTYSQHDRLHDDNGAGVAPTAVDEVWFPDAFIGPMADLLCALEQRHAPLLEGRDNLQSMALVDACATNLPVNTARLNWRKVKSCVTAAFLH